jgi:hypothetical protein
VYTIGVHNYANAAGRTATVRVYCGTTGGTTPTAIYTSPVLAGGSSGNCSSNMFWKVARVTMDASGGCTLLNLNTTSTSSARCTAF